MQFRDVIIRYSAGENNPNFPQELIDHCAQMQRVPPDAEVFLGDPDYDIKTLHSSAGFRDAYVRFGAARTNLVVNWKSGMQHQISPDGLSWTHAPGRALKYSVTYTSGQTSIEVFMGIHFV